MSKTLARLRLVNWRQVFHDAGAAAAAAYAVYESLHKAGVL